MYELDFVIDMVEEKLAKGGLRWLANFQEIQRDYVMDDITFSIYASGSLQEKGFFLSRIYSALVTPKYRIHFFLYTGPETDARMLRKIILSCKGKFGQDDWVFLGLVQSRPLGKGLEETVRNMDDKNIGIAAFSLESKETVTSNNVLGRSLEKQLKLTEAKFEAFDWPNYLKSFTIAFFLGISLLVFISLSGLREAIQPLTLLFMVALSLIVGQRIYKARYHTTLTLNDKSFLLKQGGTVREGKWSDYADVAIYITPAQETYIRLRSKKDTFDLPISRTGISRKEAYDAIRQLVKRR